jgi:predicted ATP-grasp superfamily ATP-dependent carboligase
MDPTVDAGRGRVVVITDGEQRAALATVRSLGAAGYTVIVVSSRKRSIAGVSRFTRRHITIPSALRDSQGFLEQLEAVVHANAVDVIVPITEESLLAVLAARARFPDAVIPFASLEQFEQISNKATLLENAKRVGISTPEQRALQSRADAEALDPASILFPVVIKPARSVVEVMGKGIKVGVSHAPDWGSLETLLREYPDAAYPILLQRRIVGPGIGVFLLIWNGDTLAVCGHRRIREAPPSGGVSVYREAVVPDASVVEKSRALLDQFGWQGVAMVEFKLDELTQTAYLMEVNGRFWGSLQLAIDAGVDFPALLVSAARGGATGGAPSVPTRAGVRSRWEWGEVNHLVARFRRSDAQLSLPPGSPSRGRALREFFRWRKGDRLEVFRLSDPAPFLRESLDWVQRQ